MTALKIQPTAFLLTNVYRAKAHALFQERCNEVPYSSV
jgi:hypothetical protein